ncbi:YecH family metal-binding protein [Shewanella sp. NIFS-20-20]|uniref:YecH family metal-binding protein n=1 Tax=Shewanella sp. NIFS-20-20 TaxID=2853806 RepID=UPI001C46FF7D|nr:YecH family metal-binding protein [Shewanella sp. NIFS-20-20]MBV7315169.1 YecH family protein [Shewanella sp. NIFS-20-20]
MTRSIHGHKVMDFMVELGGLTEAELISAIEAHFGDSQRFHTCKANDLNAQELLAFLKMKGKLVASGSHWQLAAGQQCDH